MHRSCEGARLSHASPERPRSNLLAAWALQTAPGGIEDAWQPQDRLLLASLPYGAPAEPQPPRNGLERFRSFINHEHRFTRLWLQRQPSAYFRSPDFHFIPLAPRSRSSVSPYEMAARSQHIAAVRFCQLRELLFACTCVDVHV